MLFLVVLVWFLLGTASLIAVYFVLEYWDADMKESSERLRAEIGEIRKSTDSINSEIEDIRQRRDRNAESNF